VAAGLDPCLYLGNLDARRDWGHAKDYVRAMWMMLQQDRPDDYVIATGVQHSVRDFVTWTAAELGITLTFEGSGTEEHAIVTAVTGARAAALKPGDVILRIDPRYFRPAEVETLLGDATRAREKLGWMPEITAREMCAEMVAAEIG
jgi:GDPmannose 4,6-dehydratase